MSIAAIVLRGFGSGGVKFIPTMGFSMPAHGPLQFLAIQTTCGGSNAIQTTSGGANAAQTTFGGFNSIQIEE